jgi:hypothetical protein
MLVKYALAITINRNKTIVYVHSCTDPVVNAHRNSEAVRIEVFTAVTVKNVVFWDINPVRNSQETHYVSTTESSQLMLCKM